MKLSVSFLNVQKKNIFRVISKLDKTNIDFLHVDVMDGKYVKGKCNLYSDIKDIGSYTRKRLDVHFMVNKPLKMIDDYALLNVFCMTFHMNIKNNLEDVIARCKAYGIKVGLAVNPEDDIEKVYPYLDKIDLVLVMSVHPGLPGQTFIMDVLPKIQKLRKKINADKLNTIISVDGGINLENRKLLNDADILVSGSAVTNSSNYIEVIEELRK